MYREIARRDARLAHARAAISQYLPTTITSGMSFYFGFSRPSLDSNIERGIYLMDTRYVQNMACTEREYRARCHKRDISQI